MARFSYTDALSTDKDKVRFYIQDTVENDGPKPGEDSATNFTDDEIAGLISEEGSWQRAVAAAFEILDAAWTPHPTFQDSGLSVSLSHTAMGYRQKAEDWRRQWGRTTSSSGSRVVTRVDAFSSEYDATES